MRKTVLALTLLLAAGSAAQAAGQGNTALSFCNATDGQARVALVSFLAPLRQWILTGWTIVPPGACMVAGFFSRGDQVLYHAEREDGRRNWPSGGATQAYCVPPTTVKRIASSAPCPTGEKSATFAPITVSGAADQSVALQ